MRKGHYVTNHMTLACRLLSSVLFTLAMLPSTARPENGSGTDDSPKHVLVLHSYHKGLTWTDGVELGIREGFGVREDIEIHTEYLDTKRIPFEDIKEIIGDFLSRKYSDIHIDAVIACDNSALVFLAEQHSSIFPEIPVVFCGINNFTPEMLVGFDGRATGVVQNVNPVGTIDLIRQLQPEVQMLTVVSGTTPTAKAIRDQVADEAARKKPDLTITWLDGVDTRTLEARLSDLTSDDAVLLCNFNRDADGVYYAHETGARLVNRYSGAPVYAMEDLYIGTGVVGGNMVCSKDQGSTAARLCIEVLDTQKLPDVITTCPSKVLIDFQAATARGLKTNRFPDDATIMNKPASFYEQHKQLIWNIVASFALLTLALVGVTFGLLRSRAAAKQLHRNEENLRVTLDSIGDAVIATDMTGSVTRMNPVAERLTGWTLAQARGKPLEACFHIVNTITGQATSNPVERVLRQGKIVGLANHTQLNSRDGCKYQIADSAAPIRKDDDSLDGVVLVFRDVTEDYRMQQDLKQAHRELKESETRLREAQGMACLGYWWWNVKTGEVAWSEEVYRIFHLDPATFTPHIDSILELSPWPEEHQRDKELIQKAMVSREQGTYEQRFLRPDGSTGHYFSTFQGIYDDDGNLTAMKGTVQDITERKRSEEQLRASEQRMELALQGADLGTWDWNILTGDVSFDQRWAGMLGYKVDELEPHMSTWEKLVHPDDMPDIKRSLDAHLKGRTDSYETEHRLRHKSGEWVWVLDKGRVFERDDEGNPLRACGTHLNITERKRAEEALRESNRLLETIVANLPGFVYRCNNDREWTMVYLRGRVRECTGYGAEDFIDNRTLTFSEIICEKHRERLWELWQEKLKEKAPMQAEYTIRTRDGSIKWVWEQGRGVFDDTGELLALEGFICDITDRKQAEMEREALEAQLRQSQKLEAVGLLAGGVAHDFNNMLTSILGNVELSMDAIRKSSASDAPNILSNLEQIELASLRASSLTRQLLTFSRRDIVQPKALNLNNILGDLGGMLRRLITENIRLELSIEPNLNSVHADAGQIEQVIVNLVVNAVHAMPDGGHLTLKTRNVDLDEKYFREHAEGEPGSFVQLSVSDTGFGMKPETIERIFEPFFTTKPVDKGTGLGLATVHGIVKRAGGHIFVHSEPGQGSIFTVYLPALAISAEPHAPMKRPKASPPATETILLCEDDDSVRELIARSLESAGYRVLSAGCGLECLEAAQKYDGTIHLLITDVIMPDMNGNTLSEMLHASRPAMLTLFISGYTSNVIAHHGVLDEGVEFLEKPFTRGELLDKVRAVLDTSNIETKPQDR